MRRFVVLFAALAALLAFSITSAFAINHGQADAGEHPYVGLAVFYDVSGTPLWRCSGTLMSPTVFLTAGHCTESPAVTSSIWFEEDVDAGIPGNGYPLGGGTSVHGTAYLHPQFDPNAFYLHDLGVVVLDAPHPSAEYGALPPLGVIDGLSTRRGVQDTSITAVGYGLQQINPVRAVGLRVRLKAVLQLVDSHGTAGIPAGTSIFVSGDAKHGGTCFGDSGGPQFLNGTNVVVAVTSFGLNQNCSGVGGGYRVDTQDDLDWLATFLP